MIRNGERKWIHRRVCRAYLPPEILRRKKRGFAVNVVDGWFNSSIEGRLPEMLLDRQSLMYRSPGAGPQCEGSWMNTARGREDNHKLLFSLAMVEQWLRSTLGCELLRSEPAESTRRR